MTDQAPDELAPADPVVIAAVEAAAAAPAPPAPPPVVAASAPSAAPDPTPLILDALSSIEAKHPLKSNTLRGLLVIGVGAVIVPLAKQFGQTPPDYAALVTFVSISMTLGGLAWAAIGRLIARQPIGVAPKS